MDLHFLKHSSILGNFSIMVLNDLNELPLAALRRIASTILASSFVSGTHEFLGDSAFPIAPPMIRRMK